MVVLSDPSKYSTLVAYSISYLVAVLDGDHSRYTDVSDAALIVVMSDTASGGVPTLSEYSVQSPYTILLI